MKKSTTRALCALLAAAILLLALPVNAMAAKTPLATLRANLSGGTKYLSDYGLTRESVVKLLTSHEKDNFFLTTPCIGGDYQSPNGDTSYNGFPGTNCAGFVSYVLRAAGMEKYVQTVATEMRKAGGSPMAGRFSPASKPYHPYLSKASNYYLWAKSSHLVCHVYGSVQEMLNDGKAEKGDVILMYWSENPGSDGVDNHIGIFWGGDPKDDKLWHTTIYTEPSRSPVYLGTRYGNHVTKILPSAPGASIILIKTDRPDAELKDVTVSGTKFTVKGSTVNAELPYGSSLTNVTVKPGLTNTSGVVSYSPEPLYVGASGAHFNLTESGEVTITVTNSFSGDVRSYTLNVTVADTFSDVPKNAWYRNAVMNAAAAGIVTGVGNGRFEPLRSVTRAEFSIMIVKTLLGSDYAATMETMGPSPFADVPEDAWYGSAVSYLYRQGIVEGYTDGSFQPAAPISRQEAAMIMRKALGLGSDWNPVYFEDHEDIGDWAVDSVYACRKAGIFMGDEKGRFSPLDELSRAQAAQIMVKALER